MAHQQACTGGPPASASTTLSLWLAGLSLTPLPILIQNVGACRAMLTSWLAGQWGLNCPWVLAIRKCPVPVRHSFHFGTLGELVVSSE